MTVGRLRSLAARITVFAVACCAVVVLAHGIVMPRIGRADLHHRFARDQRVIAELVGLIDDPAVAPAVVERVAARRGGDVTLIGRDGRVLATSGRGFAPLSPAAAAALDRDAVADLGGGAIALRVGGEGALAGTTLLLRSSPPDFPRHATVAIIALMLAMIGAASLWFARTLARPLATLARAAEQLGAGDLAARANLGRRDELGQVGDAFDAMARRIMILLDANRSLIANVSHELRTPMARIRVALTLAETSPAAAQEMLAGVGADLGELERLVEDVLTMTRLATHDALPLRRERCRPREIAEQAAQRWARVHGERRLTCELAAELPAVDGDPVLLRRVLDNLLDNAAAYSPADAPVELRVEPVGAAVRFEIVDRGAGLSPEEVAHAFTPFWRSDGSRARATGGVGLGLALARQIARAHGGDVALDSEPGRGTRARLVVPGVRD